MAIEHRICLHCGKQWRTGTMDLNRYCSTGCWADAVDDGAEQPREAEHAQREQSSHD